MLPAGVSVYVGYADNTHATAAFPDPWLGSSTVTTFDGCQSSCTYDGGALLVHNGSTASVAVTSLSVAISTCVFAIWGTDPNISIPPDGNAVFTQTVSGAASGCQSGGTFDTSDVGTGGENYVDNCTPDGLIPQVTIQFGSTASVTLQDSGQVLNTGGIDLAACPGGPSEAHGWAQIGGTSLAAQNLLGGSNPSAPQVHTCSSGDPVECATGDFYQTLDEMSVAGPGGGLDLSLTYNSLSAETTSSFGFGWRDPYSESLQIDNSTSPPVATLVQANGSTVPFTELSSGSSTSPPTFLGPSWAPAMTLTEEGGNTGSLLVKDELTGTTTTFSASGVLESVETRDNETTTFTYNPSGELTTVTDPVGRSLSFAYGTNGDVSSVTDPAGKSVSFTYDSSGDLTSITNLVGDVTSFTYDNHDLTTETDPTGGVLTNSYNADNQVVSQTNPDGETTTYAYATTAAGSTTTITLPSGSETQETFQNDLPVKTVTGFGTTSVATTTIVQNPNNLATTSVTNPLGQTTTYTYDALGNPTSVTNPLGQTTTYTYGDTAFPGFVTATTLPDGVTTTDSYDSLGNLTSISTPVGSGTAKTSYTYTDTTFPGLPTSMINPDGKTWTYTYDADGSLASSTDPLGNETTYTYNVMGERTSVTSPLGNVSGANAAAYTTTFTYDAAGDLLTTTTPPTAAAPSGATTTDTYNSDGELTSVTDANGNTTSYTYDAAGNLVTTTRPDGSKLTDTYNADGELATEENAAGITTTYTYADPAYPSLATTVASPTSGATSNTYDAGGELTSVTTPEGTTSYTYNAAGERTAATYSGGEASASYAYNAEGELTSMTDGSGTGTRQAL